MNSVEVINLAEAAQRLGISPGTATRWADRGKLPTITIAGRRLVPLDQLNQIEPKSTKGRKPSLAKQLTPEALELLRQVWEERQAELEAQRIDPEVQQLIVQAAEACDSSQWGIRLGFEQLSKDVGYDEAVDYIRALINGE
jgi:excisionase family DNA binding protein